MTDLGASPTINTDSRSSDTLQQLTILYQASLVVGRSSTESEAVQGVVKQLSYGEFDRGLIVLFRDKDEPRGEVCGHWDRLANSDQYREPHPWVESTCFAQETRSFSDRSGLPTDHSFAGEELIEMGVRSAAMVPMETRDTIVGALLLESRRERNLSADFLIPYQALASQVATVLENHRLLSNERQRAEQLNSLVEISRAFGSIADLHQTYQELTRQTAKALGARRCMIALYEPESQDLVGQEPAYGIPNPVVQSFRHHSTAPLHSEWHPGEQGPFITNHPERDTVPALRSFLKNSGIQTLMLIPMEADGQMIGVIVVADKHGGFTEGDGQLGAVLANQAAIVTRNAQLYQDQQRRNEDIESLNRISAATSSSIQMDELLHKTLDELTTIFVCESGLVSLWNTDKTNLSLVAYVGLPDSLAAHLTSAGMNDTLCALTALEGKPTIFHDVSEVTRVNTEGLVATGLHSYLGAPLVADGEVLGTICMFSASENHFTRENADLIGSAGQQVGLAVRNTRRYEELRQRTAQVQAAADVSRSASSALDQETLCSDSVELIRRGFGHAFVGLYLVDEARKWAVLQAASQESGQHMATTEHRIRVGERSLVGQSAATASLQTSWQAKGGGKTTLNSHLLDTRSEIAIPLITRERVIGALLVRSNKEGAFSEQEIAILQTTVDQIANAISNLALLEQLQESLQEIERRERHRVREDWGIQATVRDAEGRSGYEYDLMQVRPSRKAQGDSDNGHTATSTLAKPLILSGETIGTLGIEADSPDHQWTEDEIAIIDAVAGQVTQAIDRAYHSEQSERRALQLETAAQVGKAVASASMLTAAELMNQAVVLVSEQFGLHHAAIYLLNERGDRAVLQAASGHAGEVMKASNFTLPVDNSSPVAIAISEEKPHIISDTERGRWIPHPLLPETRSRVALPLVSAGQTLGALDVHSEKPAAFDQVYAAVMSTVADQVAAALVNARLFEETRQAAADQQMLFDATTVAVTTADLDTMLLGVAQTIYDRMSCTDVVIMMTDGDILHRRAGCGISANGDLEGIGEAEQIRIGEGIIGWVAMTSEPLVVGDVRQSLHYLATLPTTLSELAVPIVVDQKVVGVINIESDRPHAFDDQDLRLMQTLSGTLGSILKSMRLVEELQDAYREIKEIDRLKSEFLANMSHELRTPLNSIIGFSRVILKGIDGPISPLQEQDLSSIYNSGRHLLGLINNVLDLSKIEAGKMELAPEEVDVHEALNVVMSTAIGLAKDKDIQLSMEVPPDLPPVWMDPIRVRQVFLNLISNAVKFTEQGSITLQAAYDPQAVFVQVIDTGVGISEEDMEKLFKSFSQVDSSSTRRAGGSGLGLAISAQLMELQGGRIWVESEVGIGSTFSVALPRVNQRSDGPITILGSDQADIVPAESEQPSQDQLEDNRLILVIEDERGVIDLYHRYVMDHGFQIVSATTGKDGLDLAAALADQLHAITVDIMMPDMHGWEIIHALREHPATSNIPIIVCSIVQDLQRAKAVGVNRCLTKPILQGDLLDALAECCPAGIWPEA
jgi:GAF domain-containing protein/CheY-like chemotaxis protein